jgi:release factor glutamine methyltransferase
MPSKTTLPLDVKQALKQAVLTFKQKKLTSTWLDAEVLLAYVLKKDRAFIISHGEKLLTTSHIKRFNTLVKLRANNYPLAYIIGNKEFYGLSFFVTPVVLVPRPESELLVELALETYTKNPASTILDLGTGSGCLIISLLKQLTLKPKAFAIDISPSALLVAKKNAQKNKVKNISFIQSDLLTTFLKKKNVLKKSKQLIIFANLPYVPLEIIKKEPSIKREPRLALAGGKDGLDVYRRLAPQAYKLHKETNLPITILCEINPNQKKSFQAIWKEKIIFIKDISQKTRVGIVKIK